MELRIEGATVRIGGEAIFENVSCTLKSGTLNALIGPSGCGKTTLLNCISLLQHLDAGSVFINGEEASGWPERYRRRFWSRDAAFIYQDSGVIYDESIFYNIALRRRPRFSCFINRSALNTRVRNALDAVQLDRPERALASTLSGGEKQRLGIARAMFKDAAVLFADEPTASLDKANRDNVASLLRDCVSRGALVVVATHDAQLARQSDQCIEL
ncbi:ABC transporter related protein [Coriobacterium glomerans PW2]|uniref:ABC transporter related protein n=1 Tax=Coriobacterium glomerans (strain ATCC 49209 / DSM 20642 / JCM 10262 / PW2) TaxID=700015 RepID=F2N7M1_CORGP|nr:ATP-binding cassette domain-containing protein [Coriobacterium glomerans]AEB06913.1 ABC transporter related protein [Coriobacterium glomerans PW2]